MTLPARRRGARLNLQTRLMTAVIGMVAVILGAVGLATGTILASIMQQNLNVQVLQYAPAVGRAGFSATAADILSAGRQEHGYLLVLRGAAGVSGAVVEDDDTVRTLETTQVQHMLQQIVLDEFSTVDVPGVGTYRVYFSGDPSGAFAVYGLPTSEVASTLTQILTTVALVTVGGLLILGVLLAIIIRRSLAPLREVAETAERVAAQPLSEGAVTITERVPAAQADDETEIGRVGSSLNTLLDHVGAALDARQRNEERMRRFVADASHELRTPLASIRGYSELSLRDPALGEHTESALQRIQAQSLRMTALVEDLLLLARLEEGRELVYGTVDLSRLAIEATGDAQVAGADHRWVLDVEPEPVVIAGDEHRIQQVVVNLLANARTHTPAGTTVTVSVRREGRDAVLRVQDDGPGIDPEVAGELFERFARGDRSRARNTGGTGLGLSIARAIVEAHAGSIAVTSAPGATEFTVRLPARPQDPAPATVEP
ncbi:sensor histidine kinase [Microbacterium sp. GXF7504]